MDDDHDAANRPETYSAIPALPTYQNSDQFHRRRMCIYVCQASYGDCLALEIDHNPPVPGLLYNDNSSRSKTRRVILIDGGPAINRPTGQNNFAKLPIHHLSAFLRTVLPVDSNKMDTLVVTHDDQDHILGIAALLKQLNNTDAKTNIKNTTCIWPRGSRSIQRSRPPFASIWHNSAETVVTTILGEQYNDPKKPGYFDQGLRDMAALCGDGEMPYFNAEFACGTQQKVLLQAGAKTTRGHAQFTFIGPKQKQIDDLAMFFVKERATAGVVRYITEKDLNNAFCGGQFDEDHEFDKDMLKKPSNDPSKKNQSSIVFEVKVSVPPLDNGNATDWTGLFTGDASAATIWADRVDQLPVDYDMIKIGHHGSCYNNFLGTQLINKVKKTMSKEDLTPEKATFQSLFDPEKPFVPLSNRLDHIFPDTVNEKGKEAASMTSVLNYFLNVRAKDYIISASHDVHPNPHLSTLVGLIARSVMYYDNDMTTPVRIFLTNPITRDAWNRITLYWLGVAQNVNDGSFKAPTRDIWSANFQDNIDDLIKLLSSKEDKSVPGGPAANAGRMAIEEWYGLRAGAQFYQFFMLRPGRSHGIIHAGRAPTALNIEETDWLPITPDDSWNYLFMQQHYHPALIATTGNFSAVPAGRWFEERIHTEEGNNMAQIWNTQTPYSSPSMGKNLTAFVFNEDLKKTIPDLKESVLNHKIIGKPPKNEKKPNRERKFTTKGASWKSKMQSSSAIPIAATRKASSRPSAAESDAVLSVNATTSSRAMPNKLIMPEAKYPNWEAFRKFEIDVFDIPTGDDLIMTKLKLKHMDNFEQLLVYLALNGKLKCEQALRISQQDMVDGQPTLSILMYLLLGHDSAEAVMKTFPINFVRDVKLFADMIQNPLRWPVEIVDIVAVDIQALGVALAKTSGIQQIRFRIHAPSTDANALTWIVPNQLNLLGKGEFKFHIMDGIDITMYWPTDNKRRIVHGQFKGTLPTGTNEPEQPVICEWLVMPEESIPVLYYIHCTDQSFSTANYTMKVVDMMALFDGVSANVAQAALDALPPAFSDWQKSISDHIVLGNPGFTLSRDVRDCKHLRLHGVFGTLSTIGISDWQPFGNLAGQSGLDAFLAQIRVPTPSLRLCVCDMFNQNGPNLFFRLKHSIKIGDSELAYELETRPAPQGGRLFEFSFLPMDLESQTPLTIAQLLATFGLSPIDGSQAPDFLSKAITSTSLRVFRLGWMGDLNARLPDYLEVAIRIENLDIADGFLDLDDVFVRLRIEYPGQEERRNIYIQAGGVFHLVDVEHLASFTYGTPPILALGQGTKDPSLSLAIRCTDTPLTLGAILKHFWKDEEIIPYPFNIVTNEVGLTEFRFMMGYDAASQKQMVTQLHVGLGVVQSEVKILDDLVLISPTLEITGYYPFDATRRAFLINFATMIMIEDYSLMVTVGMATGKSSQFGIWLRAGGEGFPVGEFLRFCRKKIGDALHIEYPDGFGVLDTTYINDFSLVVGKSESGNNQTIQAFTLDVLSELSLELWDNPKVVLDAVVLNTRYAQTTGIEASFSSTLNIASHKLITTIGFGSPKTGGMGNSADPAEKVWFLDALYGEDIDLSSITSSLANIDVAGSVNGTKLEKLSTDPGKGIALQNLSIHLEKATKSIGGSFCISADTNWSVFKHIEFAASYQGSNEWGFCLCLELQSKLLSLIPVDFIKDWDEYVEVNNTRIALYVGKSDPSRAGLKRKDLPRKPGSGVVPTSGVNLALSVATQLRLTEKLGILNKWLPHGTLDIYGELSTQGIRLGVKVGKLEFGKDESTGEYDIVIDGNFDLQAGSGGLQIGLLANMTIKSPNVTKDLIQIEDAGFKLHLATGGIGFQGAITSRLRDLFGLKALEAYGLSIVCSFSLEEAGIPDELGFTGGLTLADAGGVSGHIALYYSQQSLSKCYFSGALQNLNIVELCNFVLAQHDLPRTAGDFLKGNVVINNLALEAALQDMHVKQLNLDVKAGFFYECNLWIQAGNYQWSGYTCIEARKDAFQFIAMMSPISFTSGSDTFLSLTRGTRSGVDYHIPTPKGLVDSKMLTDGPILYISTKNKTTPLLMTAKLKIVGFVAQVDIIGNKDGFDASFSAELDLAMLGLSGSGGSIGITLQIKPKESVRATLQIKAQVNLDLPGFSLLAGGGHSTFMPGKQLSSVGAEINFSFMVGWPDQGFEFSLDLKATLRAMDQTFDLVTIAIGLRPEDLDSLEKVAAAVIRNFIDNFPKLLAGALSGLGIGEIGKFVQNTFGVSGSSLVTAVASLAKSDLADVMTNLGRDFLGFQSYSDSLKMLTDFGYDATSAMQTTANVFGVPVGDIPIPGLDGGDGGWTPGLDPWQPTPDDPWQPGQKQPWQPGGDPWTPGGDQLWQPGGTPWTPGGSSWSGGSIGEWTGGGGFSAMAITPKREIEESARNIVSTRTAARSASAVRTPRVAAIAQVETQPSQKQMAEYVGRQRLDLMFATLSFFPPEEVAVASDTVFSDMSTEQVREYLDTVTKEL